MVEVLSHLTDTEMAALTSPRDGLHTVCRYLPTPADVHGFLRDLEAKKRQFESAPTSWKKIEDDPNAPWNQETDAARKRRVVQELLGYDPEGPRKATDNGVGGEEGNTAYRRTGHVSRELRQKLEAEGWPYFEKRDG
jgi:hypothetical protein